MGTIAHLAALTNDASTLRFVLAAAPGGLASAAIEFFDARDQQFWPMVQLPVLHVAPGTLAGLRAMIAQADGFAWRGGHTEEIALSVTKSEEPDRWIVEVGIDLSAYLRETARLFVAPGRELALFRFSVTAAGLQAFAAGLP